MDIYFYCTFTIRSRPRLAFLLIDPIHYYAAKVSTLEGYRRASYIAHSVSHSIVVTSVCIYTQSLHQSRALSFRSSVAIDLNVREGHEGHHTLVKCASPVGSKSAAHQEKTWLSLNSSTTTSRATPTLSVAQQESLAEKKKSKAMSLAMKPGQQVMMNAFMMYMSGSQLNIFSINTTSMAILNPLTSIAAMESVFGPLGGNVDLQMPKLIFIALNLAWLCLGLYKMSNMRLLPTTSADWTSKILWKDMMETSSIPPTDNLIF
jgi:hypothetical protein